MGALSGYCESFLYEGLHKCEQLTHDNDTLLNLIGGTAKGVDGVHSRLETSYHQSSHRKNPAEGCQVDRTLMYAGFATYFEVVKVVRRLSVVCAHNAVYAQKKADWLPPDNTLFTTLSQAKAIEATASPADNRQ